MARGLNRLTARTVASLTQPGKYSDGGGLYLSVRPGGSRQWVVRYMLAGRRQEMGLGAVDDVPLAEARRMAGECRAQLARGENPLDVRRAAREAEQAAGSGREARTFAAVRDAVLAGRVAGLRNDKHRAQWRSTLETYAAPLNALDVADVQVEHVLGVLQPLWQRVPETASRLRGRIERVLAAGQALGLMPLGWRNPAQWRGHLDELLPRRRKLSRGHHAALPWRDVPGFVGELREREAPAARLLEFAILTAARSNEARGATWDEIDFSAAVWTVPGGVNGRMKAGLPHRVPLSAGALAVLAAAGPPVPGKLIFPGPKGGKFSDMVFSALFERMGRADITAHGFRSSFRDWAGDATNFPREVIEAALAHAIENKAEAAYRRGDALEKRRELMQAWDNFCRVREANVVPLTRKA